MTPKYLQTGWVQSGMLCALTYNYSFNKLKIRNRNILITKISKKKQDQLYKTNLRPHENVFKVRVQSNCDMSCLR